MVEETLHEHLWLLGNGGGGSPVVEEERRCYCNPDATGSTPASDSETDGTFSSEFFGLTFQISDPAPLILDCQPDRHRRVRCIWFVRRDGHRIPTFVNA
jgi:hypothetical protein